MWRRCQDNAKLVRPRRNFEKQISSSKFYDEVKHIYPGTIVQKFECIGHYQKCVGNRLRKLRIRSKGLGGKNKKVQTKDKGKGKVTKAKSRLTAKLFWDCFEEQCWGLTKDARCNISQFVSCRLFGK